MKFRWNKKYLHSGITAFLVIAANICFYYLLFHSSNIGSGLTVLLNIAMPIVDGFVLAYLLTPILNAVEKRVLLPVCQACKLDLGEKRRRRLRKVAIVITLCIVIFLGYCFFSVIIPQLVKSVQSIILQFPSYINNLTLWITNLFESNPDLEQLATDLVERYSIMLENWMTRDLMPQINSLVKLVSTGLIGSVIGVARAMWNLLIGLIISIYLLDGKERFAGQGKKIIYACLENDTANIFISNMRFIHKTFIGFLGGKIVDSIIIGIICYFGTQLMDMPYPELVSVIIGVTNVIPFFGPYLGAIPCSILILMVNPLQCLYFIIFILVLQQFDGNVLGPKILGNSTGLSSFWVIFSITLFGGLLGIFGMLIGVPVFAVIYAGIKAIVNRKLEEKGLPSGTEAYLKVGSIGENQEFVSYEPISKKEKKASPHRLPESGDIWELRKRKPRKAEAENAASEDSEEQAAVENKSESKSE